MVKKNRNRRNKHGGWIGSEWFDSLKKKISSAYSSVTGSPDTYSTYTPTSSYTPSSSSYEAPATSYEAPATSYEAPATSYEAPVSSYGGRRRRKTRKMRGGYSDNISINNLAASASPFSGSTVRAHSYVGGKKTKRRCHKHKKSHKHHCRK